MQAHERAPSPKARPAVIGMPVNAENLADCAATIIDWAHEGQSRYVCVANVHMAVETNRDPAFADVLAASDMSTSDGMPLVWMLKATGFPGKRRVCGRDLVHECLRRAEREGLPVGFLGGTEQTVSTLTDKVRAQYPGVIVAFAESPPFRPATEAEKRERVARLDQAGVRILFVGLGCPNQEKWMFEHRGKVHAVMLGVGAAFDFIAESKQTAPKVLQRLGLEWLHRLASEPRRLWRRYLFTNSRFVVLAARQLAQRARGGSVLQR